MKLILVLAALSLSPIPALAADSPVAAVEAFHAALVRGDADGARRLIDEQAVIFEQGGAEWSKAQYVADHLPADIAFSIGVRDEVTARRTGASGPFAYVVTDGRTRGAFHGKPVDRLTKETMILQRGKEGWRIVHIHWSSTAPPSPAATSAP